MVEGRCAPVERTENPRHDVHAVVLEGVTADAEGVGAGVEVRPPAE
jgi:hypothetical protein